MGLNYVPLRESQDFTKEMLESTFKQLAEYTKDIDKHFAHLEGHIGQLTKRPAVIVKPNSKTFLLVACGLSMWAGYKLADRKVQEKIKAAYEEASRRFEESAQNAKEQAKQKIDDVRPNTTQN